MNRSCWIAILFLLLCLPLPVTAGINDIPGQLNNSTLQEASNPTAWERSYLTAADRLDLEKMGVKTTGRSVHVYDCGLDIYSDTPDFDNFTKLIGKYLGGGTCLGMCEIVKNAHERGIFDRNGTLKTHELVRLVAGVPTTLHGYGDLRSLTAAESDRMKSAMEAAHLDNLRPESWLPWIRDSIRNIPDRNTYEALRNRIRFGRAAKISIQSSLPMKKRNIGPVGINLPDMDEFHGHALLAYKIIEFSDEAILFVFDPNVHYAKDHSNVATGFRFDKGTGKLDFFPSAFKGRYPWAINILCIDGLTGPWLQQLQHGLAGLLQEAGERIQDGIETIKDGAETTWNGVKTGAGWVRDRAVDGARGVRNTVSSGVNQVKKWFGGLF